MNFTLDKRQIYTFDAAKLVLTWALKTLCVTDDLAFCTYNT